MTQQRRVITVIGATGKQGGSVARSLVQNAAFHVRCVTRDPSSPAAVELLSLGMEVVRGDGFDERQMQTVLQGSWGVFINNSYLMPEAAREGRYELDFGNRALRIAAEVGAPHIVFSSQPSAGDLTDGRIRTPILDVKAYGEKWARANPIFKSFTPIMSAWYLEDFLMPSFVTGFGGFPLHEDPDGYLTFRSPTIGGREAVPWISIEDDFGDLVHGVFLNPMRWNQRTVQAVGDIVSFGDVATTFADVTQRKARFIPYLHLDEYPDYGRPELKESRDVFAFYQLREGEIFGNGITESRTAADLKSAAFKAKGAKGREELTTCREWFERHFPGNVSTGKAC